MHGSNRYLNLIFMALILLLGVFAGITVDRQLLVYVFPPAGYGPDDAAQFRMVTEAAAVIDRYYVDRDSLEPDTLVYGAVTGMVNALGDTGHSRFLSPDMLAQERTAISAEFEGIGAEVEFRDGFAVIVSPFDDSPAQRAGVQPGDVILAVDGEETTGQTLHEIVEAIKGPAGTDVTLTLLDPESEEIREVTITRAVINIQNVTWARIPGTNLAHIRIAQFSDGVTEDLKAIFTQMEDAGIEGAVLDLRNNPGGLLDEAVGVTSQFLSEGNVLLERNAQAEVSPIRVRRGGQATGLPLVVLINEGSASASEIVAGALQDYDRAVVVGETSFGTGTVLREFPLSDGSALLLATREWLTPEGRVIWHQGISPDVTVEMPLDVNLLTPRVEHEMSAAELGDSGDEQLLRAVELLAETVAEAH